MSKTIWFRRCNRLLAKPLLWAFVATAFTTTARSQHVVARGVQLDVNFDGFVDVVRPSGACTGNCYFDVWLSRNGQLVRSRELSRLPNPSLDASTHTIMSFESLGFAGQAFRSEHYAFRNGRLAKLETITQDSTNGVSFHRVIAQHQHGRSITTCDALIETSGGSEHFVQINLGNASTCLATTRGAIVFDDLMDSSTP